MSNIGSGGMDYRLLRSGYNLLSKEQLINLLIEKVKLEEKLRKDVNTNK